MQVGFLIVSAIEFINGFYLVSGKDTSYQLYL
jgi:hypothetical protein